MLPSRRRAPCATKRSMSANCSRLDLAGDDQVRTADVEVIAAAAAQIHHLEAGFVLAEPCSRKPRLSRPSSSALSTSRPVRGRKLIGALQHRIGKRGRQQVAILERNALGIDRVDALRLLQAHDISLAALDHGDLGAVRVQLLRDVVAAGAGAQHQRLAALPLRGILEIAGMHHGAGEIVEAGQIAAYTECC